MVSMAVEDNADSRTDRKAQVRVTSRGQHHAPALRTKLQQTPSGTQVRVLWVCLEIIRVIFLQINLRVWCLSPKPSSKPCTPELSGFLHYNDSSGQMFHCNGVSWRPWTPTNEVIHIQSKSWWLDLQFLHFMRWFEYFRVFSVLAQTVKAQKCPRGWTYHNDFCYILSTERKASWSTAVRACRER